jgi:hypothetical protein
MRDRVCVDFITQLIAEGFDKAGHSAGYAVSLNTDQIKPLELQTYDKKGNHL